mgnify:CR=1 FL=1
MSAIMNATLRERTFNMIDNTNTMTFKGIFRVAVNPQMPEGFNLLEALHGLIYDYLRTCYGFEPDYNVFRTYGKLATENETVRVQTGSIREVEDQPYSFLWAMRIRARDRFNRRRNWLTHVGIRQDGPASASLYFAELYSDYTVGLLTGALPPTTETPTLFDVLMRSRRLMCLSGAHTLSAYPWAITDGELDAFLDLLLDPERTLPVLLITCPDLVSPSLVYERAKGNLIICWLDDYPLFGMLNSRLPLGLRTEWDTVRVFLPLTQEPQFHPFVTLQEINRLGEIAVVENLYRAFCTCLRNEDRYAFVTIDTIRDLLRDRATAALKAQNLDQGTAIRDLHLKNAELSAQRTKLSDRLKLAQEQLDRTDASEYEALLSEALGETDRLNKGLDTLIARLYADPGVGLPADEARSNVKLGDLYQALNYCFDRLRRWE